MTNGRPIQSDQEQNQEVTDPLMGTIAPGGFISETPPDIDDFLTEIGFTGKKYVCTVKQAPVDGSGNKEFLPINKKGDYPSIEELGKRFGPGQYFYCFSWMTRNPDTNKQEKIFKEYKIYLGSAWEDIYDEYMSEKWAKKESDIIKTAQKKKMHDAARGIEPGNTAPEAPDQFAEFTKMANQFKSMGVPIFNAPAQTESGNDNNMMMFMMKMQSEAQDRSDKMTMFMMKMLMDKNSGGDPMAGMFDKVFDLMKGVVNVKELLNPEKQSVVDKVFNLAESVLPAIMEIAKKTPAQRDADPLVNVVKNSADFNQMKNDPDMLNDAIRKWDAAHGTEKTDIILETVGLKRPGVSQPDGVQEDVKFEDVTETNESEETVNVVEDVVDDSGNIEPNENPME